MPIVINEVVIKATVADPATTAAPSPATADRSMDNEALIAACVDEVLRILERQKER